MSMYIVFESTDHLTHRLTSKAELDADDALADFHARTAHEPPGSLDLIIITVDDDLSTSVEVHPNNPDGEA